jgi:nucleotide-binding universal stress UspA family protein
LFKKILVPVDGSRYMEANVVYAWKLARAMGSTLTLFRVVTLPVVAPPELNLYARPLEQAGLAILENAKSTAKKEGVDSETRLGRSYGNAAEEILRAATHEGFDLIVIGAKGHSLLDKHLIGSVCQTAMHHATSPVLVLHHE